jgi:manganese/iron transport system permease protein
MLIVATAVAVASSVLGTLVSFHINGSTGPCIVLIQAGIFAAALARDQFARRAVATAAPAQKR